MKRISFGVVLLGVMLFFLGSCLNTDPGISFEQQLAKDIQAIDSYLQTNGIDAIKHASGLRIKINQLGTGLPAASTSNNVKVNYTGKFLSNGTTFDSGEALGALSGYIDGWKIALLRLPEGTSAKLYIPSGYAYGSTGRSSIPANANLIFDIEIVSVSYTSQQEAQLNSDTLAIDAYLQSNTVTHSIDASGIRYQITQLGTGAMPTLFSKVKFAYTGKFFDGKEFSKGIVEPSATFDSYVTDYPLGLKVGLQLLPVDSKAVFYIPSTLAFGGAGASGIPAHTNVIYEIELLGIVQ